MSVQTPGFPVDHGQMPTPNALHTTLRAATRRIRLLMLLRFGSGALCLSSLLCLAWVGLSKLNLIAAPEPAFLGWAIAGALLAALAVTASRKLTDLEVAKLTERRMDLKERLSSALEFHQSGIDPHAPFYGEQLADAARSAVGLDLRSAFPVRLPRTFYAGIVAALALLGLFMVPSMPLFWSKQKKQEMAEVKKQGIQIVRLADDKQKSADQQKLTETKKAAAEAIKIGEAMKTGKMDKKQSLVALQKLTKKMEETQQRMADKEAAKMQMAAGDLKRSVDKMEKDMEQHEAEKKAAQQAQKPSDPRGMAPNKNPQNAQNPPKQSKAMEQAKEAMKQMADALANQDTKQMQQSMEKLAQQMQSGQLSKEEMKQMREALQQMSQSLKETNQDEAAQQMQQLAQMMQNSRNNLDPKTLQQMAMMAKNIGQKMAMGKMGQGMLDAKRLGELAQQLKDGRMMMAMGQGKGKGSGQGGKGPGKGWNGKGGTSSPMKDPAVTKPRLLAIGTPITGKGVGKSGSAQEFAKYAAMAQNGSKHLPNAKIAGSRSQNGQELELNMTGDPEAAKSNAPYYQVYQTSKKQAESTLNKENIPAAYKDQVRKYFEEIRP